jgi:hypothetical protein
MSSLSRTYKEIFCKISCYLFVVILNFTIQLSIGMKKQVERLIFFHINNAAGFKSSLKNYISYITSTETLVSPPAQQPQAFVNLAFSQTGLTALGITDDLGDSQFTSGMFSDAPALGDDTSKWISPFTGTNIHGVAVLGSDQVLPALS